LGHITDLKEVKNIPKNYAKAMLNFIIRTPEICKHVLPPELIHSFLEHLRLQRKITNLKDFNRLVIDHKEYKKNAYNSAFRALRFIFLFLEIVDTF
jgi:regulatory protein YycH of two-component signal transduction system YycFG